MVKQNFALISLSFLVLLLAPDLVTPQVFRKGSCPYVKLFQEKVDLNEYAGTWWMHSKYPNIFIPNGRCERLVFTNYNGIVHMSHYQIDKNTAKQSARYSNVGFIDNAAYAVEYEGDTDSQTEYILGTDFKNWTVTYSCAPLSGGYAEFLRIRTRDPRPSAEVLQQAYKVIKDNKLSTKELQLIDQKDCK